MSRAVLILAVLAAATLAGSGLLAGPDIHAVDIANRLAPPSASHPLGTDHLGRDLLARLRAGGVNLAIAASVALLVAMSGGVTLGLVAAFAGDWPRALSRRLADVVQILPHIVVAALVAALFGLTPLVAGLALGVISAGTYALLVERVADGALRSPHVLAARAIGAKRFFVARRHVLPRIGPAIGAYAGADLGNVAGHYAALTFVGLGADSGTPDWGGMIYEYRLYAFDRPLLVLAPIVALTLAIAALHITLDPPELSRSHRRSLP